MQVPYPERFGMLVSGVTLTGFGSLGTACRIKSGLVSIHCWPQADVVYAVIVIISAAGFISYSFSLRDAHLEIRSLAGESVGRAPLMPFSFRRQRTRVLLDKCSAARPPTAFAKRVTSAVVGGRGSAKQLVC